jgi:hypothetical protein
MCGVREQPNGWSCGTPQQACSKTSVPMCSGSGCGTSTTYGGCSALEQDCCKPFVPMCRVRDQSRWRGRCSLAHSRCRGGGVAGDQARGRGCFSYSSLPATWQNSFDLHSFMSRISSQTCVSLDDLTYMYHKISLRSIKNYDVAVYFSFSIRDIFPLFSKSRLAFSAASSHIKLQGPDSRQAFLLPSFKTPLILLKTVSNGIIVLHYVPQQEKLGFCAIISFTYCEKI